jgi:para-nitrobenzyl esterase
VGKLRCVLTTQPGFDMMCQDHERTLTVSHSLDRRGFVGSILTAAGTLAAPAAYTAAERATMILDADCRVDRDPNREERLLWQD